jgi:hypothetical protein
MEYHFLTNLSTLLKRTNTHQSLLYPYYLKRLNVIPILPIFVRSNFLVVRPSIKTGKVNQKSIMFACNHVAFNPEINQSQSIRDRSFAEGISLLKRTYKGK